MSTIKGMIQSYDCMKKWYENMCICVDSLKEINPTEYRNMLTNLNELYETISDIQQTLERCNVNVELPSFPDFLTQ